MSTVIIENADSKAVAALKQLAISLGLKVSTSEENEHPYNSDFVEHMKVSEQDFANGKYKTITLDDIWKSE